MKYSDLNPKQQKQADWISRIHTDLFTITILSFSLVATIVCVLLWMIGLLTGKGLSGVFIKIALFLLIPLLSSFYMVRIDSMDYIDKSKKKAVTKSCVIGALLVIQISFPIYGMSHNFHQLTNHFYPRNVEYKIRHFHTGEIITFVRTEAGEFTAPWTYKVISQKVVQDKNYKVHGLMYNVLYFFPSFCIAMLLVNLIGIDYRIYRIVNTGWFAEYAAIGSPGCVSRPDHTTEQWKNGNATQMCSKGTDTVPQERKIQQSYRITRGRTNESETS